MIMTEGSQQDEINHGRRLMIGPSGRLGSRRMQGSIDNEVSCLPPIGSRIFWYVSISFCISVNFLAIVPPNFICNCDQNPSISAD